MLVSPQDENVSYSPRFVGQYRPPIVDNKSFGIYILARVTSYADGGLRIDTPTGSYFFLHSGGVMAGQIRKNMRHGALHKKVRMMLKLRESDLNQMSAGSGARALALEELAAAYESSPTPQAYRDSLSKTRRPRAFRAYHLAAVAIVAVIVSHVHAATAIAGSANPQLQRLIDIEEIKQLRARFANAVDNRRWDELRSDILAKNCVVDVPSGIVQQENRSAQERTKLAGDEAIIAFIRHALGDEPGGSHAVTIPIIETLSPTSAKGVWRLGTATYFDTYTKIDGRWRMQSIRFEPTEPGPRQEPSSPQQK
jgi:hypothetical protein